MVRSLVVVVRHVCVRGGGGTGRGGKGKGKRGEKRLRPILKYSRGRGHGLPKQTFASHNSITAKPSNPQRLTHH